MAASAKGTVLRYVMPRSFVDWYKRFGRTWYLLRVAVVCIVWSHNGVLPTCYYDLAQRRTNFAKLYTRHLKLLRAKFHTEDPQTLGATAQNSVATATWRPEFVHPARDAGGFTVRLGVPKLKSCTSRCSINSVWIC